MIRKLFKKIKQYACGLTGHKFDGDWGYGGGEYADVWCTKCDKFSQVHKTSLWFKSRESKNLMDMVKGLKNE